MSLPDPDFSPSLFHPFYFVRTGLKEGVLKFAPQLSGRMMDFGCGSKPYRIAFNVTEYIGVDYENPGHPHTNEQIDVFYDGKSIPFPDGHFDSILCSEVFEHIFNLKEILRELYRVLKPGGKMLITCPFVWNEHEVPHDFARYTRFALESMINETGFKIVEFHKAGNFITTIFQLITLYFFTVFKGPWRKVFFLRWFYKVFCFLLPNLIGVIANRIFVKNDSIYQNNIVLIIKPVNV
jgi:SAM-dependent methyltransferase